MNLIQKILKTGLPTLSLALLALGLAACGNDNNGAVQQGQCALGQQWTQHGCVQAGYGQQYGQGYGQYGQQCAMGQVMTHQGCMQQAQYHQCPQNGQLYGWNGTCVPATQSQQYPQYGYPQQNQCGTQNGMPMVMTAYNCLPQGSCPPGYGQLTPGQCIPAMNGGYNNGYPYNGGGAYWGFGWGWR